MADAERFRNTLLEGLKANGHNWIDPSWDGNPEGQARDIVEQFATMEELLGELMQQDIDEWRRAGRSEN